MIFIRFSVLIVVYILFTDFLLWWEMYQDGKGLPETKMFLVSATGMIILLGMVVYKKPSKSYSLLTLIWCFIFIFHGILNSQQYAIAFGWEDIFKKYVLPLFIYTVLASPALLYGFITLKSHNKTSKKDALKRASS